MDMIASRNEALNSYLAETAQQMVITINKHYFPLLVILAETLPHDVEPKILNK